MPFFNPPNGPFFLATPTKIGCCRPGVIANSIKTRPLPLRGGGFLRRCAPRRSLVPRRILAILGDFGRYLLTFAQNNLIM